MAELLDLSGTNTSFLLSVSNLIPKLVYWGERLYGSTGIFSALNYSNLKEEKEITEETAIIESNQAHFNLSNLEGLKNGQFEEPAFRTVRYKKADDALTLVCRDSKDNLEIIIKIIVDEETDIVEFNQSVRNIGTSHYQMNRFGYSIPLSSEYTEIVSYLTQKDHGVITQRYALEFGQVAYENNISRNSHGFCPFWLVGAKGFSENMGNLHGFHLAWTGNHYCRFEVGEKESPTVEIGELFMPGEGCIAPGELYQCPSLFGAFSNSGINAISNAFHMHVRHLLADFTHSRQGQVTLRLKEGAILSSYSSRFDFLADSLKSLGIERFVLDMKPRKTFAGEDSNIKQLIRHTKDAGIEFGIKITLSKFSACHDSHNVGIEGNGQFAESVDDHGNPQDFETLSKLMQHIDGLVCDYRLNLIELDLSGTLLECPLQQANGKTRALYNVLSTIKKKHPGIILESSSSIIGFVDAGLLSYVDRLWVSDCGNSFERLSSQNNFSTFFPPELTGGFICYSKFNQQDQDKIDFRLALAIFGCIGLEFEPGKLSPIQLSSAQEAIKLYKDVRTIVYGGNFYRLHTADDSITCWQVVSDRQDYSIVGVFKTWEPRNTHPPIVTLNGLFNYESYNIEVLHKVEQKILEENGKISWVENKISVSGEWLIKGGLQLPKLAPEGFLIIKVSKVGVHDH